MLRKRSMKLRWLALAALLVLMTSAPAAAALYTIEYNEASYAKSVDDSFTLDDFAGIDSATLSITIAGMTSLGSNYFDSTIDVTAASNLVLDDRDLGAAFETIDIDLDSTTIASMLADDILNFSIAGQDGYCYCSAGYWKMITTRFYLDKVELNVTESSSVPIPAAVWLLGSGLLGIVGIRRKKRLSDEV